MNILTNQIDNLNVQNLYINIPHPPFTPFYSGKTLPIRKRPKPSTIPKIPQPKKIKINKIKKPQLPRFFKQL